MLDSRCDANTEAMHQAFGLVSTSDATKTTGHTGLGYAQDPKEVHFSTWCT